MQEAFAPRVLRDMSTAVLVLNRKGYIMYVNRPASRMLELKSDPVPGTTHFRSFSEDPFNDDFNESILNAIYHKSGTHISRVRYQSPSGRKYIFHMSCSFLDEPGTEDDRIVITLSDETTEEMLQEKIHDSATTFSTFLFGFSIWMILYALWEYLGRPISGDDMTHGIELLAIIMLVYIVQRTSLTWHDLGLHVHRPKQTICTALTVAACACAFLCLLKAVIRIFVPTAFNPEAPFFDLSRFGTWQVLYLLTAGIQEFLARSVMQGNLKRIMVGKHRAVGAIVLSSLIFAAMHMHLGFLFMIGAAILAGLEGILYEKQDTILGVWIVHWAFGVCGTMLWLIDH